MTLTVLDEQTLPHYRRTRCQSDVGLALQRWRNHVGQSVQCQRSALYVLDGVPLCELHCGKKLLERELSKEKTDGAARAEG